MRRNASMVAPAAGDGSSRLTRLKICSIGSSVISSTAELDLTMASWVMPIGSGLLRHHS